MPIPEFKDRCDLENPEPGIYTGFTKFEYFAINAVSRSTLVTWNEEEEYLRRPNVWTPDKVLGEQYHAMVLTPDVFKKRYQIGPQEKRSKDDKAWYAELVENLGGEEYVLRPTGAYSLETLKEMYAAWKEPKNRVLRTMLINSDPSELTLIWVDKLTGMICKARIDKWLKDERWLIDLKTTRDAKKKSFRYSVQNYGYDIQAAFYFEGAVENGLDPNGFVIVAQEKTFPFLVKSYQISTAVRETAAYKLKDMKLGYKNYLLRLESGDISPTMPESIDWEESDLPY